MTDRIELVKAISETTIRTVKDTLSSKNASKLRRNPITMEGLKDMNLAVKIALENLATVEKLEKEVQ